MSARDAVLDRIRQAVRAGNRPGVAPPLPSRGNTAYQGAGPSPMQRFCEELRSAGGQSHLAADTDAACELVLGLVRARAARRILLSRDHLLERLELPAHLSRQGLEVTFADSAQRQAWKSDYFAADVGISGVCYLVAETGTLVMMSQPEQPRSVSLLPPVHIAVAEPKQILPDLFDLFDLFSRVGAASKSAPLPSCLTLVTGPSKTGDIELRLVTGVHGPGEIHVVLCGEEESPPSTGKKS